MTAPEHQDRELNVRGEMVFFWLFLLYFAGKAIFFALRIRELIFPDEASWLGMAEVFSRAALLPVDSPASYPLGLVTHIPGLYFFLMGKALLLNPFPRLDLAFLRILNVGLSGLGIVFAWRMARQVKVPFPARALFLIMLTNTMMLTFVAGAVSYDNLTTTLAVVSLYYLLRFLDGYRLIHALAFLAATLAGTLTKNVFLPYAAALLMIFGLYAGRRFMAGGPAADGVRRRGPWGLRECLLALACLVGLAANLILYGGNLLRYRALIPSLDQVLPLEACLQNRLFVRDYAARQFSAGKLSLLDAQRLALTIREPGDRAEALERLHQAEVDRVMGPRPRMGRWRYARKWAEVMAARTYSVAAHLSLFKREQDFYPYYAVVILAALLWLTRFRALALPGLGVMAFAVCFYTLILMQVVNYGIYQGSGLSGLAITGRYLFPALAAFYLLAAHGLMSRMPRWWQVAVGLAVGAWFVAGEFPWFLRHAGPEWFSLRWTGR